MRRRNPPRDPFWVANRVAGSTCACGAVIAVGRKAMYFPGQKKLECEMCGGKTAAALADATMWEGR